MGWELFSWCTQVWTTFEITVHTAPGSRLPQRLQRRWLDEIQINIFWNEKRKKQVISHEIENQAFLGRPAQTWQSVVWKWKWKWWNKGDRSKKYISQYYCLILKTFSGKNMPKHLALPFRICAEKFPLTREIQALHGQQQTAFSQSCRWWKKVKKKKRNSLWELRKAIKWNRRRSSACCATFNARGFDVPEGQMRRVTRKINLNLLLLLLILTQSNGFELDWYKQVKVGDKRGGKEFRSGW